MPKGVVWKGKSGEQYGFAVFPLPIRTNFSHKEGNYIFTKDEDGAWRAIYIGQGDLDDHITEGQDDECIKSKGATHVCMIIEPGGVDERRAMEKDLLAEHIEAYAPIGCNIKEGS